MTDDSDELGKNGAVHHVRHHQGSMMADQYGGMKTGEGGLAICVFVNAMNRLFLRPCGRDEGCGGSLPLFLLLSLSPPSPSHDRKTTTTEKKQHQNSRPELKLSHKKTKHPFHTSSYYIAIFRLFDLGTMAGIDLILAPPLRNT